MSDQAMVRITARDAAGNEGTDVSDGTFSILEPVREEVPDIALSAVRYDFGEVIIDSTAVWTLTVINNGNAELRVEDLTLGTPGDVFGLSTHAFTVPAKGYRDVTITFAPSSQGTYADTLTLASNDPDEGTLQVTLYGTGKGVPVLTRSADTYDFGSVLIGEEKTWTLTLRNEGTATLTVSEIRTKAPFEVDRASGTIPVSDSLNAVVTFRPTEVQVYAGTLTVLSDDPERETLTVALRGTGTAAPVPDIAVDPSRLSFGDVTVGGRSQKTLIVRNTGTAALSISKLESTSSVFTWSPPTISDPIAPQDSVRVTVAFAPTEDVRVESILTVTSDDPDQTRVQITLTGYGIPLPAEDHEAPPAPINLTTNGSSPRSPWTHVSTFALDWTDPSDPSGITKAYYKLRSAPTHNADTTRTDSGIPPISVEVSQEGEIPLYLWLEDGKGNADYTRTASVLLRYDGSPPSIPILQSPPDGLSTPSVPLLTWGAVADEGGSGLSDYILWLDDDADFSSPAYLDTLTALSHTPDVELEERVYYWRVGARDGAGNLSWSAVRSFRLGPPVVSSLTITPSDTVTVIHEVQFQVQVADAHGNPVEAAVRWFVEPLGFGIIDEGGRFTPVEVGSGLVIAEADGVRDSVVVVVEVQPEQVYNYPNPARGDETTFRYYLNGPAQVSIEIYDLSRDFVQELSKEEIARGYGEIQWDLSGIASGVYIYWFRASYPQTEVRLPIKKVLVIR